MSKSHKPDPGQIWSLDYRLIMQVIRGVKAALAALDLDPKELFLLAELDAHPNPAALADALTMPKPTVTVIVKRLEAAGFLKRAIDAADLRRHHLSLTPLGRKAMAKGLVLLSDAFGARLARLTSGERSALEAALAKMVD